MTPSNFRPPPKTHYYRRVSVAEPLPATDEIPVSMVDDKPLYCPVCADAGHGGRQAHAPVSVALYQCRKCDRIRSDG